MVYVVQLEILPGMYSRSHALGTGHIYRSSMPSPNFSTMTHRYSHMFIPRLMKHGIKQNNLNVEHYQ